MSLSENDINKDLIKFMVELQRTPINSDTIGVFLCPIT